MFRSVQSAEPARTAQAEFIARPPTAIATRLPIQAKLTVSAPGDAYEQEADRVAHAVMQPSGHVATISRSIQRKLFRVILRPEDLVDSADPSTRAAAPQQERPAEEDQQQVQRAAMGGAAVVTQRFEQSVASAAGGGEALSRQTRDTMEQRFGFDFSRVRVHPDGSGNQLAQQVNARAFTLGNDIFFARSQYQPESSEGQRLLAHELTHVIQQADGRIGRQIQRTTSCSAYPGYDASRSLDNYNCSGLATRTYAYIGTPSDTNDAIMSNFINPRSQAGTCNPNEIKFWMWEYQMHAEDDLGTVWSRDAPDFHIVAGPCDAAGVPQNNVLSKNGKRNVYGPASGPSWRPAARERATSNDPSETPGHAPNGRPLFKVRSQMTEAPTCAGCYP